MRNSLLILCLAITVSMYGQTGRTVDTVYLDSKAINDLITRSNYTRIPDKDLDEMLERKIGKEVSDRFSSTIAITGSILGISALLFGGILASRQKDRFTNLSTELKEKIKSEIDKEIENRFKDQQRFIEVAEKGFNGRVSAIDKRTEDRLDLMYDNINDKVTSRISEYLNKNFKEVMDVELLKVRDEQQKAVEFQAEFPRQSAEVLKIFNELKFETLKKNVESRLELDNTFKELKTLLKQAEKVQDYRVMAKCLEELSMVSFYLQKDEEFEKIMGEYVNKPEIEIKETTLVNTALNTLYSYRNTRDESDRNKTLDYLNKALRKVNDYGEALGLKLELFAMEYEFTIQPELKEKIKQEMAGIIQFINTGSGIAAEETLRRLDRVQASKAKSIYIDKIFEFFPNEMKTMRAVAAKYADKLNPIANANND